MSIGAEESVDCPSCGDKAEPEQEDDLVYFACQCGHEFGYRRIAQEDTSCQLGIPESVRFAAGGIIPPEHAPTADRPPVWLGHHIPLRRPEDS